MSQQPSEQQPPQWSAAGDSATPPALPILGPQPDPQDQYGPYYPPTVPFQPTYQAWQPAPALPAPQAARAARMPKEEAVAITKRLKAALIAGSVMAFGVLTALVAGHVTGVTARAAGSSGGSGASPSNTTNPGSTTAPTNPSNPGDNGGFFNQGPSTGSNNSNSGGFGVSPNAPAQPPISGSSVS